MSRLYSPGQLWLYRTKPQEDELLSSWLVRLALGQAVKLQSFCVQVLHRPSNFWIGDIDRHPCSDMLQILSAGTAITLDRAVQTGLSAYAGYLWATYHAGGPLAWITPVVKCGRRRVGHGQQFCRQCLAEDEQPYFRRRWRVAFNVVCDVHGTFLEDACPHCHAPVEFHAGDFGRALLDGECPITRCPTCQGDYRTMSGTYDRPAPLVLSTFQKNLNILLETGWPGELPGDVAYSHLFFEGFRYLVQLLSSRSRGRRLRDCMLHDRGQLPLDVASVRPCPLFEELRIGDRAQILEFSAMLLQQWPRQFIHLCQFSRVSSSYILRYKNDVMPYWLWREVRWHLHDKDYSPCTEERRAVENYLSRNGYVVSRNAVNYFLGVAAVRDWPFGRRSRRWNPRGPHANS